MKANVYVQLKISPSSGYIHIDKMFHKSCLQEEYNYNVETLTRFNKNQRVETIEGFELQHILVNVKYDGRKGVYVDDILESLEKQGLAIKCGDSLFGGFYKPTEDLELTLSNQLQQRKQLAGVA